MVVAVGSPHRPEAFAAAHYAIDAVKATAPIWKHEEWDGGQGWGTGSHQPITAAAVPSPVRDAASLSQAAHATGGR